MIILSYVYTDVAKLALTKCVSKVDAKRRNEHGLIETGLVKEVVYDFEFIEDYAEPEQTTTSTGQALQLTTVSGSQQRRNSADDALWFLIDNEDEDDPSSSTKETEDVPRQPLWDPQEYSALQHPLALMVIHVYICVCVYVHLYDIFRLHMVRCMELYMYILCIYFTCLSAMG